MCPDGLVGVDPTVKSRTRKSTLQLQRGILVYTEIVYIQELETKQKTRLDSNSPAAGLT